MIISIIRIFWTMCPSFLFVVFLSYYNISVCFVWGKIMTLSVLFICFVYSQHKPVWTITTTMKIIPRPPFQKGGRWFSCVGTHLTHRVTPCYTCYTMLHTILHITYFTQCYICFTMSNMLHHVTPCYTMLHTMLHIQFPTTMAMILLRGNFSGNPIEGARFSSKTVTPSRKTFYI